MRSEQLNTRFGVGPSTDRQVPSVMEKAIGARVQSLNSSDCVEPVMDVVAHSYLSDLEG